MKPEYTNIGFKEVDFYENRDLARQYGAVGHPTLVALQADGTVSKVLPGVPQEASVRAALDALLP